MTADCFILTRDEATAEWIDLVPGGGQDVSEEDAGPDWTEPANQTGLVVTPARAPT